MNSPLDYSRMSALAYLYDNIRDLPVWFGNLRPGQLKDIASVMSQWQLLNQSLSVSAMEDLERREVLRVLALCDWNVQNAAKALKIGRTTIYRKLKQWGYTVQDRAFQAQASVLAERPNSGRSASVRSSFSDVISKRVALPSAIEL